MMDTNELPELHDADHEMSGDSGNTADDCSLSAGRYDGIYLMIVAAVTLALLMAFGCGRGDGFDAATAEKTGHLKEQPYRNGDAADMAAESAEPDEEPDKPARLYAIKQGPRNHDRIHINPIGRLSEVFNDSNKYQYAAAERLGIRPMTDLGLAYFTSRPIVEVRSNEFYTVDSLKHSFPYLVPEAEKLLRDIGSNFIDSLASRGADSYRIMVTSLLRSPHTVRKLRRVNRNAVGSSTHQFGTTFDISFTRFHSLDETRTINEEDLKNLLGEVLLDLRDRGRCLVKFERKGGCFHITATR